MISTKITIKQEKELNQFAVCGVCVPVKGAVERKGEMLDVKVHTHTIRKSLFVGNDIHGKPHAICCTNTHQKNKRASVAVPLAHNTMSHGLI